MQRFVSASVFAFGLLAAPAAAQEQGKVGITMGFPPSVGLLWHVTEKVAVRPEFALTWSSTEGGTIEIEGQSFTTGVSALFYLRKWDDLATYVTPRYAFSRSSTSSEGFGGIERDSSTNTHLFSGAFGAQYWLGRRFSVFGEVGVSYQHASDEIDETPFEIATSFSSFGTRSSVGIVFYF